MTEREKLLIQYVINGNMQQAREQAAYIVKESKTQKDQTFCARMSRLIEEKEAKRFEIPLNLQSVLIYEDVSDMVDGRFFIRDQEKEIVDKLLLTYKSAGVLAEKNIRYMPSLLLHGESGTGKTTLAKYIAYKAGLPFYYVNFSFLLGQYLGETQKSLGRIFEFVRKTPCVFCFDELDAVALKRGASSDVGEMNRVVIALMQELDRVQNDNIIIATTNRFDSIDPALHRRFSHIEEITKLSEYDALKMAKQFFDYVEMPEESKKQSDLAMLRLTFYRGENPCIRREYTPAQVQSVCIDTYLHYIESSTLISDAHEETA